MVLFAIIYVIINQISTKDPILHEILSDQSSDFTHKKTLLHPVSPLSLFALRPIELFKFTIMRLFSAFSRVCAPKRGQPTLW